jgi:hypothetical protein
VLHGFLLLLFRDSYYHKELLLRAELMRVALIIGSPKIIREILGATDEAFELDVPSAIELYELAISNARDACFTQYEALSNYLSSSLLFPCLFLLSFPSLFSFSRFLLSFPSSFPSSILLSLLIRIVGMELLGLFWLTIYPQPKEQIAQIYLHDAIAVYDKWGANAKSILLHEKCALISQERSGDKYTFPVNTHQKVFFLI